MGKRTKETRATLAQANGGWRLLAAWTISIAAALAAPVDVRVTRDNTPGSYVRYDGLTDAVMDACSTGRRVQVEPAVAVNPRNPAVIVAGAIDSCRSAHADTLGAWMGYYRSADGGVTWQSSLIRGYPEDATPAGMLSPASQFCYRASDPTLGFDRQGRVYYAFVCFNSGGQPANGSMLVAQYDDDGSRYLRTMLVARGTPSPDLDHPGVFHDKPNLVVDQTGGPGDGNVYVAWTRIDGSESFGQLTVMFAASTDHGATFSLPRVVASFPVAAGRPGGTYSDLAVAPDGTVYLVWVSREGSKSDTDSLLLTRSRDYGRSFEQPKVVASYVPFDSTTFSGYDALQAEHKGIDPRQCSLLEPCPSGLTFPRFWSNAAIAADAAGVHIVWSARRPDGQSKIFALNSADGVAFPKPPQQIDTVPAGHQWFPDIASSNGKVIVVFYDSRADGSYSPFVPPGDTPAGGNSGNVVDAWSAVSTDGGSNWVETRMSTVSFNPNWVPPFIGDYIYVSAATGKVWSVWTDTRDIVPGSLLYSSHSFRAIP